MEEYKRLQTKLDSNIYNELELFWINNTNFTAEQADRFVSLLEKINTHSKEIKRKQKESKND